LIEAIRKYHLPHGTLKTQAKCAIHYIVNVTISSTYFS